MAKLRNKIYPEERVLLLYSKRIASFYLRDRVADWRFESESWAENESEGEREEGGRSLSYP